MIWGRVQPHLVVDTILLDVLFDLARIHPTTVAAVLGLTLNNLDAWFSIRTKWKGIRKVALLHNEIFFTLIFFTHANTKLWPINFKKMLEESKTMLMPFTLLYLFCYKPIIITQQKRQSRFLLLKMFHRVRCDNVFLFGKPIFV